MQIRLYEQPDIKAIVRLSLRAWAPVFVSIEKVMNPDLFQEFYPDWRESQRVAVEAACSNDKMKVWVADENGSIVGFVAAHIHSDQLGEIHMLAVDPDYQRRGIAMALTDVALDWLTSIGMTAAMVETGGDPGHAPARHTYEKSGFELWPTARYFKKLNKRES